MKTIINLNFQMGSEDGRPDDASLNRESIVLENLENIPSVGDYVCFDNEKDFVDFCNKAFFVAESGIYFKGFETPTLLYSTERQKT